MTVTADEWVAKLESFEGVPFHHMGRNRFGVDCYGLLVAAADELGISDEAMHEVKGYRRLPGVGVLESNIGNFLVQRPYNRLQPLREQAKRGDILVFYIEEAENPRHLAAYLGVGPDRLDYIIHADARYRKVTKSALNNTIWKHSVHSVWYSPRIVEG